MNLTERKKGAELPNCMKKQMHKKRFVCQNHWPKHRKWVNPMKYSTQWCYYNLWIKLRIYSISITKSKEDKRIIEWKISPRCALRIRNLCEKHCVNDKFQFDNNFQLILSIAVRIELKHSCGFLHISPNHKWTNKLFEINISRSKFKRNKILF